MRERFGSDIYIVVALTNPERFYYGGDLLFQDEETLTSAELVDSFVAMPPSNVPSSPGLKEQISNVLELLRDEFERRAEGGLAAPPLGASHWVQSLADPSSRELWMKWLPRYHRVAY